MISQDISELVRSERAQTKVIPENQTLFSFGDQCEHYVIVQTGSVRVELLSKAGQQLLLYRITEGQSCVMTTSCLLSGNQYFAQAISETPVDLVLIPQKVFHEHLMESSDFRTFVFNGFSERLTTMIERTADLATSSIDQRLAASLLAHTDQSGAERITTLTHEQLAIEIGSAREVVSRRLALFEKNELIEKQRGHIRILNVEKLSQLLTNQ